MSQNPASAEQKADTGPLTLPPVIPGEQPARRMPIWMWAVAAVGAALLIGAVVYFTRAPDPMSDPRPVEVVSGFVAAVEAKDASKMLFYVVPTEIKREIGPELRAYLEYVDTLTFSDSAYTLIDNDGQTAHVRWTATMHYKLNFGDETKSGDKPVDRIIELTKIEGAWYLQNAQLPET
ncbi:MAG: hypothetical protein ACJ8CR_29795 [Roseiflexaceae bacterium]